MPNRNTPFSATDHDGGIDLTCNRGPAAAKGGVARENFDKV